MSSWSGVGRPPVEIINGSKTCSACCEVKPVEQFYRDNSAASGYAAQCKSCRKSGSTPPTRKDSVLFTKYGIRLDEYETMYESQDGRCAICNTQYDVLCVDHNHLTKKVRGLLCRECNFGLGKFGDDANRVASALAYLLSNQN